MQYKQLGDSGLWVSSLTLGTMTFGNGADEITSASIFYKAIEHGINLFDCADMYAKGEAESILRPLIKSCRNNIILTTKAYFPTSDCPNDRGNSRLHLTNALHQSLKRLDTEYIDIFYLHHFDDNINLRETLLTLDDFVKSGKVRYIGFSNFSAWQTVKAIEMQKRLNLNTAIVIQPMYNLLKRQVEVEILPMAKSENLGVLSYSPLAAGMLTGKYASQNTDGRLSISQKYKLRYQSELYPSIVSNFVKFAESHEYSPVALAIAWVCAHPQITAPIIGVRNVDQLDHALAALSIKMTPELRQQISSFSPTPPPPTDRAEEVIRDFISNYNSQHL